MVEAAIHASYEQAVARRGVPVTFRRVIGAPPNATVKNVVVNAIVMTSTPDPTSSSRTGYAEAQTGAFTQKSRRIMVMADDLLAATFPLPVEENDTIVLADGRRLNVISVDAETRALAGAIDLIASGIEA